MTPDLTVLSGVFALQFGYAVYCRRLSRAGDQEALSDPIELFERDIVERASSGHPPDWQRYADHFDRIGDGRVETLRLYASAALATGIGGTMLTLGLSLLAAQTLSVAVDASSAVGSLMTTMSTAVLASFLGIVNHLYILLDLVPAAERRAAASADQHHRRLRTISDAHRPQATVADAIRSELGAAFRAAIQEIPAAFEQLRESVKLLGADAASQSQAILDAGGSLRETATILRESSAAIHPAAERLATATETLVGMPAQFAEVLDRARDTWIRQIRDEQQGLQDGVTAVLAGHHQLLLDTRAAFEAWDTSRQESAVQHERNVTNLIRLMQGSSADVAATVATLPAVFADQVARISETLGQRFGVEARIHVADLALALHDEHERLVRLMAGQSTALQNTFLSSTGEVVSETLQKVYARVEGTLLHSLDDVGRGLKEALVDLPNHADGFAASLAAADARLQTTVEAIRQSAEHLERVAHATTGFESAITSALRQDAADHLSSFDPLRRQIAAVLTSVRDTHAQTQRVVEGQVSLINELMLQLAAGEDA